MIQLKPCPFCNEPPRNDNIGRAPKNKDAVPDLWFWVFCGNCGAHGPYEITAAKARRAWNERD